MTDTARQGSARRNRSMLYEKPKCQKVATSQPPVTANFSTPPTEPRIVKTDDSAKPVRSRRPEHGTQG